MPLFAFAQETQKVIKKNKDKGTFESFYVLKTDTNTKSGPYELRSRTGVLSGFYKNGLEDSIWAAKIDVEHPIYTGQYTQGKRSGVWEFYNDQGKVAQKYDFDNKILLYDSFPLTNMKCKVSGNIKDGDVITNPLYMDGTLGLLKWLNNNATYPKNCRDNDIQGTVIIGFNIEADGVIKNIHVVKSASADEARSLQDAYRELDNEALRLFKLAPPNWLPATVNHKPVSSQVTTDFVFRLR